MQWMGQVEMGSTSTASERNGIEEIWEEIHCININIITTYICSLSQARQGRLKT